MVFPAILICLPEVGFEQGDFFAPSLRVGDCKQQLPRLPKREDKRSYSIVRLKLDSGMGTAKEDALAAIVQHAAP